MAWTAWSGRDIRLDGQPYRVVGVLPDTFTFLSPEVRVYVPLAFSAQDKSEEQRWSQNHEGMGRLAAGVTIQQARARLDALNAVYTERAGPLKDALINAKYNTVVNALEADLVRDVRSALQLLWGGVLFVLLIAAVNITNLSLVRASGRVKELATRHALGAARSRVMRQLVTETTLVTLLGGAAGLGVGYWCVDALKKSGIWDLPRAHEIHMDGVVIAFTFGVAVLLGLVVGAVPALQLSGFNLNSVLREEGRGGTASRSARYVRRSLVVAQVALAFILLIGAGLLLASFRQLLGVDPGFRAEHVITGRVSSAGGAVSRRCGPAVVRSASVGQHPGAARHRSHRSQQLPALQLGRQQQRHHSGRLRDGARRVSGIAQPAVRQRRVSPGAARAVEARAVLHGERQ